MQWFQLSKETFFNTQQKNKHLDTARTVLQFISQDLKYSGYLGCRTEDNHYPVYTVFADHQKEYRFWRKDRNIFGFKATPGACAGRLPRTTCQRVKENTDILIIYNIPRQIVSLKQAMQSLDVAIEHESGKILHKGSLALISDCHQADIFIANEVLHNKIFHQASAVTNISSNLSKKYGKEAEVTELQTVAYYLGVPLRQRLRNQPYYSLYRDDLFQDAEEVAEGIVDFQIEYGVFKPPRNIQYQPASSFVDSDWRLVRSVRLTLKLLDRKHNLTEWHYEFAIGNRV